MIGFLEALPVCPMAPLVFVDFLSSPPGALRSASCRFRRGSARQMGSHPVYWTSSNLQGCIVSRRRVSRTPFTSDSGCPSHFDGKPQRLPKACQMASRTQTEDDSLLRVPQEVPAAHMTASLRLSGSQCRTPYGQPDGTWSFPWAAKAAMKTSRPVNARIWAAREDPGLQSELGGKYTRPSGGCHEHAARFDHAQVIGKGPGLIE